MRIGCRYVAQKVLLNLSDNITCRGGQADTSLVTFYLMYISIVFDKKHRIHNYNINFLNNSGNSCNLETQFFYFLWHCELIHAMFDICDVPHEKDAS